MGECTNYGGMDLTRHPALKEAFRIACLIEACGASEALTTASCAAFDFIRMLDRALPDEAPLSKAETRRLLRADTPIPVGELPTDTLGLRAAALSVREAASSQPPRAALATCEVPLINGSVVDGLEHLLRREADANVEILPDGSVRAAQPPDVYEALKGLVGLVQLVLSRDDLTNPVSAALSLNHRYLDALKVIDAYSGATKESAQ